MRIDDDSLPASLITWALVIGLSCWGGLIRYLSRVRMGQEFSFAWMLVSMVTSAFAGVLTYLLCCAAGISGPMAGAMVGISGWMGTEALNSLEALWRKHMVETNAYKTDFSDSPNRSTGGDCAQRPSGNVED